MVWNDDIICFMFEMCIRDRFYDTFMEALQNISPVPIRMMQIEGEAKGYYHQTEKYIAIQEDMSNLQTMRCV